jgi:hypothetical protein
MEKPSCQWPDSHRGLRSGIRRHRAGSHEQSVIYSAAAVLSGAAHVLQITATSWWLLSQKTRRLAERFRITSGRRTCGMRWHGGARAIFTAEAGPFFRVPAPLR